MPKRVNVDQLIADLENAGRAAGFSVESFGRAGPFPLLGMRRSASADAPAARHTYVSGGIHGDEPAGALALLETLRDDALPRHHHLYLCPLLNPRGLAAGSRETPEGLDLNRDYTRFRDPGTAAHRNWIEARLPRIDLAVHLHEDWEAKGFYLYELNFTGGLGHAAEILRAVEPILPIESATEIDGHGATDGIIRPDHVPDIPEGLPEAIFFHRRFDCLNYTLETPSAFPMERRLAAQRAALRELLR